MYSTERAANIIVACAVLHNLMIRAKYPEPPEKEIAWNIEWERRNVDMVVEGDGDIALTVNNIRTLGVAARARLIREFF